MPLDSIGHINKADHHHHHHYHQNHHHHWNHYHHHNHDHHHDQVKSRKLISFSLFLSSKFDSIHVDYQINQCWSYLWSWTYWYVFWIIWLINMTMLMIIWMWILDEHINQVAGDTPCLPGLFMAGVFSGSLRFLHHLHLLQSCQDHYKYWTMDWTIAISLNLFDLRMRIRTIIRIIISAQSAAVWTL